MALSLSPPKLAGALGRPQSLSVAARASLSGHDYDMPSILTGRTLDERVGLPRSNTAGLEQGYSVSSVVARGTCIVGSRPTLGAIAYRKYDITDAPTGYRGLAGRSGLVNKPGHYSQPSAMDHSNTICQLYHASEVAMCFRFTLLPICEHYPR